MFLRHVLPFLGLAVLVVTAVAGFMAIPEREEVPAAVQMAEVVALTNNERFDKGIPVLARNALLDQAAQMKAEDMASKGYYAHVSPEGITPMYWVEKAGYRYLIIGENLVVNRTDAGQVVSAFMGSPGHRANILRKDFTEIGVGVAKGTYKDKSATFTVQIFAAPYPGTKAAVTEKPVAKPTLQAAVSAAKPAATTTAAAPSKVPELAREVRELVARLVPEVSTATTAPSIAATSSEYVPTVFQISSASPVELSGVSQIETKTTPIPVGSTWTMQFRAFLEQMLAVFI